MSDELVLRYQQTGDCAGLIEAYRPYIEKFQRMFLTGDIDFGNYDIRRFLACYISDKETVRSLCRGKYHSKQAIQEAYRVLEKIRRVFDGYESDELFHELLIPFLTCARCYEPSGKTFSQYLYSCFRYRLKRLIDERLLDTNGEMAYWDMHEPASEALEDELDLDRPEYMDPSEPVDLHSLLWLNGTLCGDTFRDLTYTERYILVKAYEDGLDERAIAQLTGLHHRSVYRIRKRLIEHFRNLRDKGELKWIR
ncbi:sigma-70 family RNA polymerase sigma factor [Alicyclobacillus shizuokensis]|uniref:sigma-70 family RNA polymerase sigma factor n=1 Tax=Alicyclobacillus shizuokensis TaxID=392014 RepID=UPI000831F778|nr:sigma-70 family RNA polymerase sigma factor [Alicyclobacillus shizuokensis]